MLTLQKLCMEISGIFTTKLAMLNKRLQELLSQYPWDCEVILASSSEHGYRFENLFSVDSTEINHCNVTTKWESNVDYYSFTDTKCVYRDQVDGKIVELEVPMSKEKVIVLGD